ncbi:MAG: hypothetical protein FH761_15680 [Firmicutes bacterium]|nr:hypothetical protein [Bacillota bacterium]
MQILSKETFLKASNVIKEKGRPIDFFVFQSHFFKKDEDKIINELKKFQNEDGGFGNNLEPDFRLPSSSPMATSIAFQHLIKFDDNIEDKEMIIKGLDYLEKVFISERNGWLAIPQKVNDYPHTPWWHVNEDTGECPIDNHWGNPSAEIIGYLYNYREHLAKLNADKLVDYSIDYLNQKDQFQSFHEIYCYIRLYKILPLELSARFYDKLKIAVGELVSLDSKEWSNQYVARPLDFIKDPENTFGIDDIYIEENLNYLIEILEEKNAILPSWGSKFYNSDMDNAWNEWIGVLTLRALLVLDSFSRIELEK